ncbi:MAG: universal stress protein [Thermodesulfobacteriota bacterium]
MDDRKIGRFLELFDLGRNFTDEELKAAYRDLVQVWHPDKYSNSERLRIRAESKIKLINEAYGTLEEILRRKEVRSDSQSGSDAAFAQGPNPNIYFGSIFHTTDFSELSDIAFAHALRLALSSNARLELFHVLPTHGKDVISEFPRIRDTLVRWNIISKENAEDDLRSLGFSYSKVVAVHKDPVASILNYLRTHPSEVNVLAAHTRSGPGNLLHRSVAGKVSRDSGGWTLFIKDNERGFVSSQDGTISLRNILIPIDSEPDPMLGVYAASRLAQVFGNKACVFTLLYVGEPADMPVVRPPGNAGWVWNTVARRGSIVENILGVADEVAADVIVMGTKGNQGFLDALRGSTTEQILRRGLTPLLTVPERRIRKR